MENKDILKTWLFPKSGPSVVWDYLTKPELIGQWLMKTDFQPIVGQKFQFINNEKIDAYCEVLEMVPLKRLSYSWRKGPKEQEWRVDSVVIWMLTEKDGGTELQLQHNGFTLVDDFNAHSKGWDFIVNRFMELLNPTPNDNAHA